MSYSLSYDCKHDKLSETCHIAQDTALDDKILGDQVIGAFFHFFPNIEVYIHLYFKILDLDNILIYVVGCFKGAGTLSGRKDSREVWSRF